MSVSFKTTLVSVTHSCSHGMSSVTQLTISMMMRRIGFRSWSGSRPPPTTWYGLFHRNLIPQEPVEHWWSYFRGVIFHDVITLCPVIHVFHRIFLSFHFSIIVDSFWRTIEHWSASIKMLKWYFMTFCHNMSWIFFLSRCGACASVNDSRDFTLPRNLKHIRLSAPLNWMSLDTENLTLTHTIPKTKKPHQNQCHTKQETGWNSTKALMNSQHGPLTSAFPSHPVMRLTQTPIWFLSRRKSARKIVRVTTDGFGNVQRTRHRGVVATVMISDPSQEISFAVITWNPESSCTAREKNHFLSPINEKDVARTEIEKDWRSNILECTKKIGNTNGSCYALQDKQDMQTWRDPWKNQWGQIKTCVYSGN